MIPADPVRPAVPPLWCPFPEQINPAWRQMQERATAWAARWGLAADEATGARLAAIGAGELAARVTAEAGDTEAAQFAADQFLWLFAFDDAFCDEEGLSGDPARMAFLVADLVRTAQTGEPRAPIPTLETLADLRRRLDRISSPVHVARWVNTLRDYFSYQVWEAGHRAMGTAPDLAAYLVARISSGSMPVCLAVVDVTNGYEAGATEMELPVTRALTEMCCAVVSIDNDILSYWKETLRSGDGLNLVDVLARSHQTSPAGALREAVALRDRVLAQYLRVRAQALPAVEPLTRRYIAGLDGWIRGNLDWGMGSARYLNPDNPADLPTHVTPHSAAADADPGPLPGLAWWWQIAPSSDDHMRRGALRRSTLTGE